MMRRALTVAPGAGHLVLLSGDCMPLRPLCELRAHLEASACDHIEARDFFRSGWIKTGLRAERVLYRHPVNERRHPRLFRACWRWQQRLGLERRLPAGLPLRIGSQWWALRRRTAEAVLAFCRSRPEVPRFFRTSWIPDETFFQTVVAHLVPAAERSERILTQLIFSDYGMPVSFHDDQAAAVMGSDRFFLRKLAPGAEGLRRQLAQRFLGAAAAPAEPVDLCPPARPARSRPRWSARRWPRARRRRFPSSISCAASTPA